MNMPNWEHQRRYPRGVQRHHRHDEKQLAGGSAEHAAELEALVLLQHAYRTLFQAIITNLFLAARCPTYASSGFVKEPAWVRACTGAVAAGTAAWLAVNALDVWPSNVSCGRTSRSSGFDDWKLVQE